MVAALQELRDRLDGFDNQQAQIVMTWLAEQRSKIVDARWEPYPWQVPPGPIPTLGAWMMLGGRGTGKTEGAARYFDRHMRGPGCDKRVRGGHRALIVAPTMVDAVDSCLNGPSGLNAINPSIRFSSSGGYHVVWPNGAEARIMGAYAPEDIERLRAASNRCCVWLEEAAAMRHLGPALEHTSLGLRIGKNPHYVISTTPKPRKEIKRLVADPTTLVTTGRTSEAHHLDPVYRQRLFDLYGGTRLGRQELDAEIIGDTEGALWNQAMLDAHRLTNFNLADPWTSLIAALALHESPAPIKLDAKRPWVRLVGVDPPGETAECGIVVGMAPYRGRAGVDHAVILDDMSIAGTPEQWGRQVVAAVHRYNCSGAIVEANYGGDMCRSVIHNVDPGVNVRKVTAKENKFDRAEPISTLYARGYIHHLGYIPGLEEQITTWVPTTDKSPDRLDALAHLITALLKPMPPVKATATTPLGRTFSAFTVR